jgi:hypothetical protein
MEFPLSGEGCAVTFIDPQTTGIQAVDLQHAFA